MFATDIRLARIISQDVALPGDPRFAGMGAECYVIIGYDKRQNTTRLVDVDDYLCIELLQLLKETQTTKYWRLFRASSATLRRKLKLLCKELGWKDLNFVPQSLRFGGAVYD